MFKTISDVPVDIVELGAYKGETLLNLARFLETLCPGDREKKVIGFDPWQELRGHTQKDGQSISAGNIEGAWTPSDSKKLLIN